MLIFYQIALQQKVTGFYLHGLLSAEHPRLIHVDADHGEHLGFFKPSLLKIWKSTLKYVDSEQIFRFRLPKNQEKLKTGQMLEEANAKSSLELH